MAQPRHPQKNQPQTPPAALAQQILADPNLDPHTLAAAIERLTLAQTLQTLAHPHTTPADRAAALHAFHQWRQADLTRQRLQLEQQKIDFARQRLAPQPPPHQPPPQTPPPDQEAAEKILLDQLDQILGLKPRSLPPPTPPPPSPEHQPPEPPFDTS